MKIEILTIFPDLFQSFLQSSLIGKAIEKNLIEVRCTNIRDFADPPHFKVDDTPYGGGAGMVMKPEPLARAITAARARLPKAFVVLFTPAGHVFTQSHAIEFAAVEEVIFVCGRYEGVDERVIENHIDVEMSIGDYILMGGEVPAMVVIEATARLLPGVLGNAESPERESFADSLLEAPQYTRPPEFEGEKVPPALLSGNHAEIEKWRKAQALARTRERRPDLLEK